MTEDRRQTPERRKLLHRPGGRRLTDPEPSHGTRARYQQGCPCTPCKAAEATYRANLRKRKAHGRPILGALVEATETWRLLRVLRPEYDTRGAIATALGYHQPMLQFGRTRIRQRTALLVRRFFRLHTEGADYDPTSEL